MTRLILIRHGQTDVNLTNRFHGQIDTELNATGIHQAEMLAKRLSTIEYTAVYTSPLKRARKTAEVATGLPSNQIMDDARIIEQNFGKFEWLSREEAEETYPEAFAAFQKDRINPPPEGETSVDLATRTGEFLAAIAKKHPDETVLAFSHAAAIRTMLCVAMEIPLIRQDRFSIKNTGMSTLQLSDDINVLTKLNDQTHLD